MSSRAQPAKAAAVPSYSELVSETDDLLKRQRQKGAEYKFREGPGRAYLSLDADAPLGETQRTAAPVSPGGGGEEGAGSSAPAHPAAGGANPVDLDSYDPNEQAAKEHRALVETVSKMRGEASHLYAEVGALTRRYDSLRAGLEQLTYEDDVDHERKAGLAKMKELKARTQFLALSLEDAEHYSRVLNHVIKRLTGEKLSKLGTMKAFEDALRVQRQELELAQEVQRGVLKSRDEEVAELARMQAEAKRQLASLDRKLEARRMEVKVRQEKAKWRIAKLQEELSLKAQAEGDLTEEEERAMILKAKNLSHEASELRAEKIRMQADADTAEEEYSKIRFAAGVTAEDGTAAPLPARTGTAATAAAAAGNGGGGSSAASVDGGEGEATNEEDEAAAGAFAVPDPAPVIHRFNTLEDEMRGIEDQLDDYNNRVTTLQQQLSLLRGLAQPRAKDARDEADRDVAILQSLRDRITFARRALEASGREGEDARSLRMQLEQSVSVLTDRLGSLPPPFLAGAGGGISPAQAEGLALAGSMLDELGADQPTPWAKSVHDRTVAAAASLQAIMRAMDPVAAAGAAMKAHHALARHLSGEMAELARTAATANEEAAAAGAVSSPRAAAPRPSTAGASASSGGGGGDDNEPLSAGELEVDRRMDATIESLIVKNEWSIRVRPGSGAARPSKAISGRALAEAVQAFEKTWKDASSGVTTNSFMASDYLPTERTAPAGSNDHFSKEASRQRRRNSRIELETAYASAAVAASAPSVQSMTGGGDDDDAAEAGGRGKKKSDGKPKTKDISRFLATAAAMAGDDVDDAAGGGGAMSRKEAEDVLTRDRLKRDVKVATAAQQQAAVGGAAAKGGKK